MPVPDIIIMLLQFEFNILTTLVTINVILLFTLVVHDFGVELSIRAERINNNKVEMLSWAMRTRRKIR